MFTQIKSLTFLCLCTIIFLNNSCKQKDKLEISGQIKNNKSKYVILDEIHFNLLPTKKWDTIYLKENKFTKDIIVKEQSMFRLVLPEDNITLFFVNDKPELSFDIDAQDHDYKKSISNTPLNIQLHKLTNYIYNIPISLNPLELQLEQAENTKNQILVDQINQSINQKITEYQNYILNYADTTSSAVLSMFAFSNAQVGNAQQVQAYAQKLIKKFPNHNGVNEFLSALEKNAKQEENAKTTTPAVGSMAPDFTLNGTDGKPLTLSSFKGKYVLVDFWASWCGPCRAENEHVVNAYNKFKNKNFTILGVSLDEKKDEWIAAIREDQLTWTHVSDLQGWESKVVSLYAFDGIPYNILLDPSGKILATSLRGDDLEKMLEKTLP